MAWSTLNIADVLDEMSPQEQSAFNTIQGAQTTQGNILARVIGAARGHLKAGGNPLDAANTIPDQIRNEVIDLTLWRWLKKFPALKNLQTKERKEAFAAAMATLKEISEGKVKVELPASPDGAAAPVNAIQVARRERRELTRGRMSGL